MVLCWVQEPDQGGSDQPWTEPPQPQDENLKELQAILTGGLLVVKVRYIGSLYTGLLVQRDAMIWPQERHLQRSICIAKGDLRHLTSHNSVVPMDCSRSSMSLT